jgi:hypothetical protein
LIQIHDKIDLQPVSESCDCGPTWSRSSWPGRS